MIAKDLYIGFELDEVGLRNLFKDFDNLIEQNSTGLRQAIHRAGLRIESRAKSNTNRNTDLGVLKGSIIQNYSEKGFSVAVGSEIEYAPYVEFGTGAMVSVPTGLEGYAMQFKGAGIKEVNLPARPYLYPAFTQTVPDFLQDVEKLIKEIQ